jgi:hypothetical protein
MLSFADRAGGGTMVTLSFNRETLLGMTCEAAAGDSDDQRMAALTRAGSV